MCVPLKNRAKLKFSCGLHDQKVEKADEYRMATSEAHFQDPRNLRAIV